MNKGRLKRIINIINKNNLIKDRCPENLRLTLEELGPTFIKIGQILSTRVDLFGDDYIKELSKLRSNVSELDFKIINDILFENYGNYNNIFSYIEEKPIGSASIAQVHRARLKSGEEVVLKIKRPGVDEEIKEDFELLKECIKILHLNKLIKVMDINLLVDELFNSTLNELDFELELRNMVEFAENNNGILTVGVPCVYDSLSSKSILVMEYVEGININEVDKLVDQGYKPKTIAKELSTNYIKQALDDGLFHADPHPDNIIISDDSIVFLDWGMVGRLNEKNKKLLSDCVEYIVMEDYVSVTDVLINMCSINGEFDKSNLINDVGFILKRYASLGLENISVREFAMEMFNLLRNNNLVLSYDITMLIRGICIIEGVIERLDSSTNLIEVFEEKLYKGETIENDVKKVGKKVVQTANSIPNIFIELDNLIKRINDKDFKLKLEMSDSSRHVDKLENLVHEIVLGFLDGCLIVAYSIVDVQEVKFLFLIAIIFISAILGVKMLLDLIHNGYN